MGYTYIDHVTGDLLEQYTQGRLSESDLDNVEDHVLICGKCRSRVFEAVSLAESLKAAEWKPAEPISPEWPVCFRRTTKHYWRSAGD